MLSEEGAMAIYHVDPLPFRTTILRAMVEACLPLAIEFAIRPHRMTAADFTGQGVICVLALLFFHQEEPYDLELDASGIRKIKNGLVERAVSSERIRYARESGRGSFQSLAVSEHALAWLGLGRLTIPERVPEYEQIKAQVLSWVEHPRGNPAPLSLR
jgi:hypothetical protein